MSKLKFIGLSSGEPSLSPGQIAIRFAGHHLDRLVLVAEDIEYLAAFPKDRLSTHIEVRLAAGVLRRLVLDN